jgi:uncharacterized Fe-S cluster-containing radical SAM superfamily protein
MQHFMSWWIRIQIRGFDDQSFSKITLAKNIFLINKLQISLALGLKDVKATVQEKPTGLQRKHPPLENVSFLNFLYFEGPVCPP